MKEKIYLDFAAATPIDDRVLAAQKPYLQDDFYNPSAMYLAAKNVRRHLDEARFEVANVIGARASEVIFTAGGSESNNLAIHGVMRTSPDKKILVSAIEHESVLAAAQNYNCVIAPVHKDGTIDLAAMEKLLDESVILVSIANANNEVGTIQQIREISKILSSNTKPGSKIYFHTDATQAANYLDLHVSRLGIDLMTLNGGKIYGPKQTGALFVRSGVPLTPILYGGGQERGLRSGTENVAGAVGFSRALTIAQDMRREESSRLQKLQQLFITLLQENFPAVVINGSLKHRLPNNVHVTLPGVDNERVLMALDDAGIMAAAGSACSASKEEPSHVLKAMGNPPAYARSSLRFTMGRGTSEEDIRFVVAAINRIVPHIN